MERTPQYALAAASSFLSAFHKCLISEPSAVGRFVCPDTVVLTRAIGGQAEEFRGKSIIKWAEQLKQTHFKASVVLATFTGEEALLCSCVARIWAAEGRCLDVHDALALTVSAGHRVGLSGLVRTITMQKKPRRPAVSDGRRLFVAVADGTLREGQLPEVLALLAAVAGGPVVDASGVQRSSQRTYFFASFARREEADALLAAQPLRCDSLGLTLRVEHSR
eukprot:gnl/Chilomastix_cuspidata/2858.p1 GENE.gnl/Chilomastix_cuspidata/2858~~gnl/Chilomastix_cuspidata/2858.p1  ORF type:complete len:221 (+),score=45.51 gnl/Chilomastix_cuspidata/2858:3-665(+)